MNNRIATITIIMTVLLLFRIGRCLIRQDNRYASQQPKEEVISDQLIHRSDLDERTQQALWNWKYNGGEPLKEEEMVVILKDVNKITKVSDEIAPFAPSEPWENLHNDYIAIQHPKDWSAIKGSDDNTVQYSFRPNQLKKSTKEEDFFEIELLGLANTNFITNDGKITPEQLFPYYTNRWWQEKADNGLDIRNINRIKFLGYDAYQANGPLAKGKGRFPATIYLVNTPKGIYQFTIVGSRETRTLFAKTAMHIFQTFIPQKEI
jgi:hypothetical protein